MILLRSFTILLSEISCLPMMQQYWIRCCQDFLPTGRWWRSEIFNWDKLQSWRSLQRRCWEKELATLWKATRTHATWLSTNRPASKSTRSKRTTQAPNYQMNSWYKGKPTPNEKSTVVSGFGKGTTTRRTQSNGSKQQKLWNTSTITYSKISKMQFSWKASKAWNKTRSETSSITTIRLELTNKRKLWVKTQKPLLKKLALITKKESFCINSGHHIIGISSRIVQKSIKYPMF